MSCVSALVLTRERVRNRASDILAPLLPDRSSRLLLHGCRSEPAGEASELERRGPGPCGSSSVTPASEARVSITLGSNESPLNDAVSSASGRAGVLAEESGLRAAGAAAAAARFLRLQTKAAAARATSSAPPTAAPMAAPGTVLLGEEGALEVEEDDDGEGLALPSVGAPVQVAAHEHFCALARSRSVKKPPCSAAVHSSPDREATGSTVAAGAGAGTGGGKANNGGAAAHEQDTTA